MTRLSVHLSAPFPFLLGLLFACLSASDALSAEPYQPQQSLPLMEKWRWRELEPLRHQTLFCGVEDQDGRLWFAAESGLVRYDGFETEFVPLPASHVDAKIFQLFASQNGKLYAYTNRGLLALQQSRWSIALDFETPAQVEVRDYIVSNSFGVEIFSIPNALYRITPQGTQKLLDLQATPNSVAIDAKDRIWVSLNKENHIERIQTDANGIATPRDQESYNLEAETGWLYARVVASPESDDIWAINWRPDVPAHQFSEASNSWIREDLAHLSGDNSLVGGQRLGPDTLLLVAKTNALVQYQDDWREISYSDFEMPTNAVFTIYRQNGNIVIGGQGEPIFEIELSPERWRSYSELHFQCETSNKRLWYLSLEGDVIEQDSVYNKWIRHDDIRIDTPVGILRTQDDYIWIYGSHSGQPAVAYYNGTEWIQDIHPELVGQIGHQSPVQLRNGDVLFGSGAVETPAGRGGIIRYSKTNNSRYIHAHISPPNAPGRIASIAEDAEGNIWMSGNGLHRADPLFSSPAQPILPFANEVWVDHVVSDHSGNIWVALWNKGLFQKRDDEWIHYAAPERIRENQVSFIYKDRNTEGTLWFGTSKGVSRFDGENWFPHCLPGNIRFNRESGTLKQSSDGAIWVNTSQRSWFFRTGPSLKFTRKLAESFKTTRYVHDTSPPLIKLLKYDQETTFPSNIVMEWTATDLWSATQRKDLRYSHRLNDGEWSPYTLKTTITLSSIPSGSHSFQVRAVDMDGNESALPAQVTLLVRPPIWQRSWFIAAVTAAGLSIVILISLLIRQGVRHIIQIEEFKLQFFTNISHELRTPLTVIIGPIESLLKKNSNTDDKIPLELAHKNARKMLTLIDQLLDFRSAEQGNIKINRSRSDLIGCVRETVRLITPLAAERSQTLQLEADAETCLAWFDTEKVEKVITNLLSNAIKYTQKNGAVKVAVRILEYEDSSAAQISVEDNGAGIPHKKIDNIFELFYRAGNSLENKVRGSGIGLAYTKNLVELCNGSIDVESPITEVEGNKQGSRFTVILPMPKDAPALDAAAAPDTPAAKADASPSPPNEETELENNSNPVILIIEDDDDIRVFLNNELKADYQVIEAEDGLTGWNHTFSKIPDIVLTDVMMPNLNGKELCKKIKSTESTSHIPVIMLTALKSESHEMSGLESGADDYIPKPIRIDILKQRIHNLINSRKLIHEQFKRLNPGARISPQTFAANPVDESFMTKAIKTIEENTADPYFDVEGLASTMNMSRMTLYRKFKAVTGQSPSVFIRSIRMNKAAEYLRGNQHNVSEISDLVGYSEISHFSTSFKKHFNCTPTQFREQARSPK